MARIIIKLEDQYLEWSTMTDSPITYGMKLEEFYSYYKEMYGLINFEHELPSRMERVEQIGTSAFNYPGVDEFISHNRAGRHEKKLSKEQILAKYVWDKSAKFIDIDLK